MLSFTLDPKDSDKCLILFVRLRSTRLSLVSSVFLRSFLICRLRATFSSSVPFVRICKYVVRDIPTRAAALTAVPGFSPINFRMAVIFSDEKLPTPDAACETISERLLSDNDVKLFKNVFHVETFSAIFYICYIETYIFNFFG
jgi:hypothetical protein